MRRALAAAALALAGTAAADGEITRPPSAAELRWYGETTAAVQRALPSQLGKLLSERRELPPAPPEVNASGKVPLRYKAASWWKEPREERDPLAAPPDLDAQTRKMEALSAELQAAMDKNDLPAANQIMARMTAAAQASGVLPREPRKVGLEILLNPGTVHLWKAKPARAGPPGALAFRLGADGADGAETVVLLGAWKIPAGAELGTLLPQWDPKAPGAKVQAIAVRARGEAELAEQALQGVRWPELTALLGR